jgi:hypothetical protein
VKYILAYCTLVCGDPPEVAGAARAFETEGGAGGLDERGVAGRVDRLHVRQEEEVAAGSFEHGGVFFRLEHQGK